ncbi:T9SS type A sorting domain-containing protein [Taibaiella soli]|uniref:Secretion system C-terminal sorting domain-containing protein n=1 Tax=Taibaiella soli TaxID=1649169 RepID=A0A2W2AQ92_9BACT|nr:T9SS type A sorting domain-containing protein [Taibaiella soli]PZF74580.1 hypothetical protein DN068_03110 [Taibaiella soli]
MNLKHLFTLCFCVFFLQSNAQTPYRCLIPGDTSYFINSNNYLRAITIDSVTTVGTDLIYHPFRTLRGHYDQNQILDSNGGSWLGKNVIAQSDGTWLFDSYWGDTLVIKTKGIAGDSWTLYDDTSSYSYTATIYAADTFSFSGVLDSIKKIRITAYNNGTVNTTDSLNDQEIWLSKNHGFAKVINLYMFPFRQLGWFGDLYAETSGENPYTYPTSNPGIAFGYTNYRRPTIAGIYDVYAGDLFQYEYTVFGNKVEFFSDSVTSVNHTTGGIQINIDETIYQYNANGGASSITHSQIQYLYQNYDLATYHIPEHDKTNFIHYYPVKDFYGYSNSSYQFDATNITPTANGYVVVTFEPCYHIIQALNGIGDLDREGCYGVGSGGQGWKYLMTYARKNGQSYGTYNPTGVAAINQVNAAISIYPNPANNEIHFALPANLQHIKCCISDITGRTMLQQEITSSKNKIDVSALAAGLYMLTMNNGSEMSYQKIEIVHP